MLKYTTYAAYW